MKRWWFSLINLWGPFHRTKPIFWPESFGHPFSALSRFVWPDLLKSGSAVEACHKNRWWRAMDVLRSPVFSALWLWKIACDKELEGALLDCIGLFAFTGQSVNPGQIKISLCLRDFLTSRSLAHNASCSIDSCGCVCAAVKVQLAAKYNSCWRTVWKVVHLTVPSRTRPTSFCTEAYWPPLSQSMPPQSACKDASWISEIQILTRFFQREFSFQGSCSETTAFVGAQKHDPLDAKLIRLPTKDQSIVEKWMAKADWNKLCRPQVTVECNIL